MNAARIIRKINTYNVKMYTVLIYSTKFLFKFCIKFEVSFIIVNFLRSFFGPAT